MRDRGQGAGVRLLVGLALMTSGCVTTLGYVPEGVKPKEDKETLRASYKEVRKWASDVADGYDSRNTMNRHAIYAGATLAAASVSAIAGLAAFGSNSSALIGIPIGASFLGALAAIYQSDEKAAIYREGAQYVKDLIVLSEERLQKFDEDDDGALRVAASEKAETAARRRVADDKDRYAEQKKLADEAANKAKAAKSNPASTDAERTVLDKTTQSLQDLVKQAERTVAVSEAALKEAEARTKAALHYQKLRQTASSKDEVKKLFLKGEAVCLQRDVNGLMAKVADHIAVLDPKDLAARLKAVKAESKAGTDQNGAAAGGGSDKGTAGAETPRIPPPDLSDLAIPAKSSCMY